MNAPTIISVSAAIGQSVPDALLEEMRRAEIAEMYAADLESRFAQRHFVADLQSNPRTYPRTWASAYRMMWDVMHDVHQGIFRALICLRHNLINEARALLVAAEHEAEFDSEDEPVSEFHSSDIDMSDDDMV